MAKSDKILEKKQNQILKEFREMNNAKIIGTPSINKLTPRSQAPNLNETFNKSAAEKISKVFSSQWDKTMDELGTAYEMFADNNPDDRNAQQNWKNIDKALDLVDSAITNLANTVKRTR